MVYSPTGSSDLFLILLHDLQLPVLDILVLYGELIPPSLLNSISNTPPPPLK